MDRFPSVLEGISDLSVDQIHFLLNLARKYKYNEVPIREFDGTKGPFRPIIATSFLENSTRTKHSFAIAIKKLDCIYLDFNAETSSLKKGETLYDTLQTLSYQGVDLCIIRTNVSGQLNQFKEKNPIKIII